LQWDSGGFSERIKNKLVDMVALSKLILESLFRWKFAGHSRVNLDASTHPGNPIGSLKSDSTTSLKKQVKSV